METEAQGAAGWIAARGEKWHRAITPEPTFMHPEKTACGITFTPRNVTWNGQAPPSRPRYLCLRPGCGPQ
jgi:hypothetical protein